ncbi:MAG TPA: FMN-binding negative transcriptional regulator [Steroidobacteraceae bacterium]|nr:FMN-binding negative transcriptional regulator [Steroidobacteraceae bacterium]
MYSPSQHAETDVRVLHSLIRAHPLGTWATQGDGELIVNHVPFLLDQSRGDLGTLVGHVARANDVWRTHSRTVPSAVIFQGAETYISPSWYPSKHAHGKAVPTWNYAVVHAHGLPQIIEDKEWLLEHLNKLTDTHETGQKLPWKVSDAPTEYLDRMIGAIVGVEIRIAKLVGKWKVSQNRPEPDKLGVVAGLLSKGDEQSREMAALVDQFIKPRESRG